MNKFIDSAKRLIDDGTLKADEIIDPGMIAEDDLLRVHTPEYINTIATGEYYGITKRKLGLPWSAQLNIRSRTALYHTSHHVRRGPRRLRPAGAGS